MPAQESLRRGHVQARRHCYDEHDYRRDDGCPSPRPAWAGPGPRCQPRRPTAGCPSVPHAVRGPARTGGGEASAISAFTNITRGALGESRTINNQELVELLRSTQDNGDGTSTLLFVTLSNTGPGGTPPDNDDGDAAGILADVPVEHWAGRGDPVPPAGSPMFADPAGAAPATNPAAEATTSRPAAPTMTSPRACWWRGPGTPPRRRHPPGCPPRLPPPRGPAVVTPRRQWPWQHRGNPGVAPRCRVPSAG